MWHMYLEVYESYLYFIPPFCHGNSSKQLVKKEQGIDLENCDPEPEHRLLYQVELWGVEGLWGDFHDIFAFHASFKKQTHINKTAGNWERSYHVNMDSGWYFLDDMLIWHNSWCLRFEEICHPPQAMDVRLF